MSPICARNPARSVDCSPRVKTPHSRLVRDTSVTVGSTAAAISVTVRPRRLNSFAEASGKRAKTDPVDAAMLARFGATLQPDIRPAPPRSGDRRAERVARPSFACSVARRALVKDRRPQPRQKLTLPLLQRQNLQRLKQIEAQIEDIDREQAALVMKQQSLKARFAILLSIPGLGPISAHALLIDMPELGTLVAVTMNIGPLVLTNFGPPPVPLTCCPGLGPDAAGRRHFSLLPVMV